ncbi:uncharacterized protein LOC112494510 [Cephus cinctus]|uniref:Uncharacterized protein LOC112494510 n=1 Tax=Cephus cinctus TaxID=211228 RepID=A0AAJ7RJN5_CEPCN|nr:uncharacterized protein LOC112494510 [Cephus cinctus]
MLTLGRMYLVECKQFISQETDKADYKYVAVDTIMSYTLNQQLELIALAELAGISATPGVFRIITELLALQASPEDVYVLLKQVCPVAHKKKVVEDCGKKAGEANAK